MTDRHGDRVRITIKGRTEAGVRCDLNRLDGSFEGSSYIDFFPIVDGRIDLGNATNFSRPKPNTPNETLKEVA